MSGLIIIPIFIFYTLISFFVLRLIIKKIFSKLSNKIIIISTLSIVLIFPIWDYITANLLTNIESKVIEYPIRDKNGKYDSFNSRFVSEHIYIDVLENSIERKKYVENLDKFYLENTQNFIELESWSMDNLKFRKNVKIYLDKDTYPYSFLDNTQARYVQKFPKIISDSEFFGFTSIEKKIEFVDTKKNKVIGYVLKKSYSTNSLMNFFRKNILFWIIGASETTVATITKEALEKAYIPTDSFKKKLFQMENK